MHTYLAQKDIIIQRIPEIPEGLDTLVYAQAQSDDETFVYDRNFCAISSKGTMHLLNLTATIIFEECARGVSREGVTEKLSELFEADASLLKQDVEEALDRLLAAHILVPAADSSTKER